MGAIRLPEHDLERRRMQPARRPRWRRGSARRSSSAGWNKGRRHSRRSCSRRRTPDNKGRSPSRVICLGAILVNSARLIGRICAKPMLFNRWNMNGQNRPILPPAGWVSAAMNRQSAAGDREQAADDHLADLVGLAALEAPPFPEGGDRDEHREAEDRVERDQPAAGMVVPMKVRLNCWSPQTR